MAVSVALSELKLRSRERADMVNSTFISDSELTSLINESYSNLYDSMVATNEDYFISSYDFTLTPGNNSVDVPSDFYKLRGVDASVGGETYVLKRYQWSQRHLFEGLTGISPSFFDYRYRLTANKIYIVPKNNVSGNFTLWYTPTITKLVDDSDTFDSVNGWDKYVVLDVAIKMLNKEESDPSALMAEKAEVYNAIKSLMTDRDYGEADKIERWQDKGYRVWGDTRRW